MIYALNIRQGLCKKVRQKLMARDGQRKMRCVVYVAGERKIVIPRSNSSKGLVFRSPVCVIAQTRNL